MVGKAVRFGRRSALTEGGDLYLMKNIIHGPRSAIKIPRVRSSIFTNTSVTERAA
jgi:hypothetical protein